MGIGLSVLVFVGVVILLAVILSILKISMKTIFKILINALIGGIVLYILNLIPGINLPINWLTTISTGLFGVPAVIVILIYSFIK